MKVRLNKLKNIKTSLKLLAHSYKADKTFLFALLLEIILSIFETLVILDLVGKMTLVLQNKLEINKLIILLVVLVLIKLVKTLINSKMQQFRHAYIMNLEKMLLDKSMSVSFSQLESPSFYILQEQAEFSLRNQYCLENLLEAITNGIENLVVIITTIAVITSMSPLLGIVLLVCSFLNFYIKIKFAQKDDKFYEELAPINRRFWYYEMFPFDKNKMLDIKVNHIEEFMSASFKKIRKQFNIKFKDFYQRQGVGIAISDFIANFSVMLIVLFSARNFFAGKIDLAIFNISIASIIKFSSAINGITESIVDFWRYSQYASPILEFLDIEAVEEEASSVSEESLIAKDLSFGYKNHKILKGINFEVDDKKLIVVIGENGAGKSTLIKLISGLYQPEIGQLSYKKLKMYGSKFKNISSVYQDFTLINDLSIKQNIACSLNEIDDERIESDINKLNWNTTFDINDSLGKELDDDYVELSGGQAQQVAVLRALYQDRDILILDEPAAALDIEKEKGLYDSIARLRGQKIIFLISHRLSAATKADEVWFMKDGRIQARGTHEQVMKESEDYNHLYSIQASRYQNI
ncbi:hypothetical protein BG262_04985 [Floricoccus penangensis]|uniref:ABC transporter ATP-binding protein n=1 Tax=Floricoccus penangensis TaxID=1859475 RepID=A0A9Q5JGA2_9LACT|nr:hypothetical protein BG262_04985 [Floricoccus penangensis]